jgi:hypothetical protein
VNYIFNYYKNTIAVENDKEEFTSSNYIFWITNNLFDMYSQTSKKGLGKLIEGPCHNKRGNKNTQKWKGGIFESPCDWAPTFKDAYICPYNHFQHPRTPPCNRSHTHHTYRPFYLG